MKCLSLWQPWATLLAAGLKRVETAGPLTLYCNRCGCPYLMSTEGRCPECRDREFSLHPGTLHLGWQRRQEEQRQADLGTLYEKLE